VKEADELGAVIVHELLEKLKYPKLYL